MFNVFEVSKKICEAGNWEITNLQLQKMLYIAQVFHLGQYKHHLFRAKFEAWDYGPVAPMVYHEFKIFGNKPIEKWAFPQIKEECSKEENEFIEKNAKLLAKIPTSTLVGLTHRHNTAWYNNYKPGARDVEIPEKDMETEFKEVWLKNAE